MVKGFHCLLFVLVLVVVFIIKNATATETVDFRLTAQHRKVSALTSFLPKASLAHEQQRIRNATLRVYEILREQQVDSLGASRNNNKDDDEFVQRLLHAYKARLRFHNDIDRQNSGNEHVLLDEEDYQEDVNPEVVAGQPFDVLNPCAPKRCRAKFTSLKTPFEVPCSTASGSVPSDGLKLPLLFPGNYDLCRTYEFAHAHFCAIETFFVVVPLLDAKDKSLIPVPVDFLNLGNMFIGKCVSDKCGTDLLKKRFVSGLQTLSRSLIASSLPQLRVDIAMVEAFLESTTFVSCVKEDAQRQGEEFESMGTALFFFLTGILLVFSIIFTTMNVFYPQTHSKYILAFSITNNIRTLGQSMRGEYVFLNGVRVISMMWIVYGHTVLQSTLGLQVPLANPSAIDYQVQGFWMTVIHAAEFSVDTFFFMSGLLATHGILDAMYTHRMPKLRFASYLGLIFVRFLRLTPVYMFVMFFYIKAMPYCGDGPYWHLNNNRKDIEHFCRNWFTNLFYFNNLYPFGLDGGTSSCMGWTWYLANDMQFFLLVPLLVAFFLYQWTPSKRNTTSVSAFARWIMLYGPCASLVLMQIVTTGLLARHYDIHSVFDIKFMTYIYVKPWCRIAPYAIGCWLAFHRFDRIQSAKFNPPLSETELDAQQAAGTSGLLLYIKVPSKRTLLKHILALFGLGLTSLIAFVHYDDFRCDAEPDSDCRMWFAFTIFGSLANGNWSQLGVTAYVALGYATWSFGLALMVNYAADGNGGIITRFLSHPVFNPLARLSYSVYMIHLIVIQMFYTRAPAEIYSSQPRQMLDTIGFVFVSFLAALFLYCFIERPFTTLLPWCAGFDKDEKRSQRSRSASMPLTRELSFVTDVDSESVIIGTPMRRSSIDEIEQPLLRQ